LLRLGEWPVPKAIRHHTDLDAAETNDGAFFAQVGVPQPSVKPPKAATVALPKSRRETFGIVIGYIPFFLSPKQ
jgi:hypothetical protein